MRVEFQGNIAHQVFNEHRVFVSPLGNRFFVLPLQQCVQLGAGRAFNHPYQVLNPNRFARPNLHRHLPSLIVRSVSCNRFRTRAERRHHRFDCQHKIDVLLAGRGVKASGVIHHAFHARNRRLLHHEIGEFHLQVRSGSLKLLLHRKQNVGDVLHVHHAAMAVKHFDETAHVGAFELLGQIHEHANGGDGVLHGAGLVANLDGEPQSTHADLVNAQLPVVAFALLVVQIGLSWRALAQPPRAGSIGFEHVAKIAANPNFAKKLAGGV